MSDHWHVCSSSSLTNFQICQKSV